MSETAMETILEAEAIARRVRELGAEISAIPLDGEPLFLGLLSGAEIFLADLVRALSRPVRFEMIRVAYSSDKTPGEALAIHYPIPLEVRDHHVFVVKDVVTSGVTESYLGTQLKQQGARSVRFVALVDLAKERKTEFAPDFHAFALDRAGRLVGYGMKIEGRFGNLPQIARLHHA